MELIGPRDWSTLAESADTWWKRWRGVKRRPDGALLIPRASVHGFGLTGELWAVALDADLTVISVCLLRPRSLVWIRGAAWILELPRHIVPPRTGDRLTRVGPDGEPERYGGRSLPLLHPDRQSGRCQPAPRLDPE